MPVARRTAIRTALAATLLAASAACSPSPADKAGPGATVRTEPAPTTTTNPYAVPTVIDAAYVNRVLAGLDALRGDVTRLIVRTRTIPQEAYDRLRAMYGTDRSLQLRIDNFQGDLSHGLTGYNAQPGNQITTIAQLISASSKCIFARVARDYSAVGPGATPTSDKNWVSLIPLDGTRDPRGYNSTQWSFSYDGFPPDRSQPPDPCAG